MGSLLKVLLEYQFNATKRYFSNRRTAKIITAVLFVMVLAVLAVGIYFFFRSGFIYIERDQIFHWAILNYVIETFLLTVGFLILASALIAGIFFLFRNKNDLWILAAPYYNLVNRQVFYRLFFTSLWPFLVVILPVVLAAWKVYHLGFLSLLFMIGAMVLYVVFLIYFALILLLGIAKILYWFEDREKHGLTLARLSGIILAVFLLGVFAAGQRAVNADFVKMFRAEDLSIQTINAADIASGFRYLPSHLAAHIIFSFVERDVNTALKYLLYLMFAAVAAAFVYKRFSRWYLSLWQVLQEGVTIPKEHAKHKPIFVGKFSRPTGAIMIKEGVMLFRNTRNIMWFSFLVLLWMIQTFLNIYIKHNLTRYSIDAGSIPVWIYSLQFVVLTFFMSSFILRFVFPTFSVEAKTVWILGSAPINIKRVFWAKYVFFALLFVVLGLVVSAINYYILGLPLLIGPGTLLLYALAVLFSTTLGISLGAAFPNFETDDPQVLSTSLPGLMFVVCSLAYGIIGARLLNIYFATGQASLLNFFAAASVIAIGLMLYFAPKILSRLEFSKNSN